MGSSEGSGCSKPAYGGGAVDGIDRAQLLASRLNWSQAEGSPHPRHGVYGLKMIPSGLLLDSTWAPHCIAPINANIMERSWML